MKKDELGYNAQFNVWTDVIKGNQSQFQGFFKDLISGTDDLGSTFGKLFDGIGDILANMAAQWITNELFGMLLGKGGGGLLGGGEATPNFGGGGGGLFGGSSWLGGIFSIFDFANGGGEQTININILINMQGGGNQPSIDVPQLKNVVQAAVVEELQRQQQPGGVIGR